MPPENKPKTTPKDFFLHLGAFTALYVSAISLLRLWFDSINTLFPDQLDFYGTFASSTSLRLAVASLIVAFPLYLFLTRFLVKEIQRHREKGELWIRKWLTYLTLFIAGVTLAVDLITLVNTFLSGELTTRFLLKVIAVLIVAGVVLYYYSYDLRRDVSEHDHRLTQFAWGAVAGILLSIIGGFLIIGSPSTQRQERFDKERVFNLQSIQSEVASYWQHKEALPVELVDLEDSITGFVVPTDPESGETYEYNMVSDLSFELCAVFARPSAEVNTSRPRRIVEPFGSFSAVTWEHGAGRVCFERTIDPDIFPPIKAR
jgi:hypothetical protein